MLRRTVFLLAMMTVFSARTAAADTFSGQDVLKLNGFFSFSYEQQLGHKGDGDPNGSFDMNLFDLMIAILPVDNVRLSADVSFEHGPQTEDGLGNVNLAFAFVEYTFTEPLKLRAGKFFVPFGIYNELHNAEPTWMTVNEPRSTNKNTKLGAAWRFFPRWGAGIEVLGNGRIAGRDFDYVLLLSNGDIDSEHSNAFEEDDNAQKAVTGRVRFWPVKDIELGASVYRDVMTEYDEEGEATGGRIDLLSYGAQATWKRADLGVELEYVGGYYDPSAGDRVNRYGLSALVHYTFGGRFTPYLEWQFFDPDTDAGGDGANLYVYGLRTMITEALQLKVEMDTFDAGRENPRFADGNNRFTEFTAAIVYRF